jgi:hypothetical protein
VSDEIKTCDGCGQLTRNAAFRSCDDCEPDTETIAQLRRELEANRKGWHDCNQKLAEEYAGHCVTKRSLEAMTKERDALQIDHECAREILGEVRARAERYRTVLAGVMRAAESGSFWHGDPSHAAARAALSDEPEPTGAGCGNCDLCLQGDGRRCPDWAPTTEEEPKE